MQLVEYDDLAKKIARSYMRYNLYSKSDLESMALSHIHLVSQNLDNCDPKKIKQYLNRGVHNLMISDHRIILKARNHENTDNVSVLQNQTFEIREIIDKAVETGEEEEVVNLRIQGYEFNEIMDETGIPKTNTVRIWNRFYRKFVEIWHGEI